MRFPYTILCCWCWIKWFSTRCIFEVTCQKLLRTSPTFQKFTFLEIVHALMQINTIPNYRRGLWLHSCNLTESNRCYIRNSSYKRNKTISRVELSAVVWAVVYWQQRLRAWDFIIYTDSQFFFDFMQDIDLTILTFADQTRSHADLSSIIIDAWNPGKVQVHRVTPHRKLENAKNYHLLTIRGNALADKAAVRCCKPIRQEFDTLWPRAEKRTREHL